MYVELNMGCVINRHVMYIQASQGRASLRQGDEISLSPLDPVCSMSS